MPNPLSMQDAFMQGQELRQTVDMRRANREAGNALAGGGNLHQAADAYLSRGLMDQGMALRQEHQGQKADARNQNMRKTLFNNRQTLFNQDQQDRQQQQVNTDRDQRIREAQGTATYFSRLRPMMDQPGFDLDMMIAQDPQGFEAATGMNLQEWGQLTAQGRITPQMIDQIIAKAEAEAGIMPAQPEAPPANIQELMFRAQAAGLQPGTPEYQEFMRTSGRTGQSLVTVNNGPSDNLTAMQEHVDKQFAPLITEWVSGGGADATRNLAQIRDVQSRLQNGENLSGPLLGLVDPRVRVAFNEGSVDAQQLIEEVVQRNLRIILGAQFTAQEGERLIARAYNPQADEATNSARLQRLFNQMEIAAQQRQAMVDHYSQHGTMRGFDGRVPSVDDFYSSLTAANDGANTVRRKIWNAETGQLEPVE